MSLPEETRIQENLHCHQSAATHPTRELATPPPGEELAVAAPFSKPELRHALDLTDIELGSRCPRTPY